MKPNISLLQSKVKLASAGIDLPYTDMQTPGDRIRMLRQARGLTQLELAQRMAAEGAAVTPESISQWERGETKNIRPANLIIACRVLETTPDYVWFGPPDDPGQRKKRPRSSSSAQQK